MNILRDYVQLIIRYCLHSSLFQREAGWVILAFVVFVSSTLWSESSGKVLRLRNEIIQTPSESQGGPLHSAQRAASRGAVSGVYLIQFKDRFQPAWRKPLADLGVKLQCYVPDDAFVARLNGVSLDQLETLEFVHWVGAYRSDHKIHSSMQDSLARPRPDGDLGVSILLAPGIAPAEFLHVKGALKNIKQESHNRFGSVLRGHIAGPRLQMLAESPAVLWVEPYDGVKLFDEVASKIVAGDGGVHLSQMQTLGLDGSGVTVAVADSGLHNGDAETMHPDLAGRVDQFLFYGALTDASDGNGHGTHVAGIVAGNGAVGETDETGALYGLGVAPGAHIVAQRIFDDAGGFEAPATFEELTRDAVQSGAEIGSNSWGDDNQGRYDTFAAEFDALVRDADAMTQGDQPYILEFSAGNAGPGRQTIGTPAVAKNVIASGASQNSRSDFFLYDEGLEAMADFSSRGPAEDGRIKPDVVAPGTWISSLQSASATDETAWSPISTNYQYQGGTSQAGPLVSGAAAVFVQYYRVAHGGLTPSPAMVKAALINSAVDMDDRVSTGPVPNDDEGWGRVDLTELIGSSRDVEFLDQTELLTTGQTYEQNLIISDGSRPLKITLTYTDVPGFPGAIPALVNDLDLEVIDPAGNLFRGNQFDAGESVPNAAGSDSINNVEGVHLSNPLPGDYLIRVRAQNVVGDARVDTSNVVDQDFALVVSGIIPIPGAGVVFFDRRAYRVPDQIQVKIVDADLAGQGSVQVVLQSTTEFPGETITLSPQNSLGFFTGTVMAVTGVAQADGQLQIGHDDIIEAVYVDASTGETRIASARADLVAPQIAAVSSTNQFGNVIITWQTDELADSMVHFDTNFDLLQQQGDARLVSNHTVSLDQLVPGTTYWFRVSSMDEAGNVAMDDNGGGLFSFVAVPPSSVLLVDSYADELFSIPPLSGYTEALDQIGISYEVWDATVPGTSPSLTDLEPYQAVLWRVPEFFGTFTLSEQGAITNYLNSGGSLLVASMDVLSRLDESGFSAFRTNVLKVLDYSVDHGVPSISGVVNDPISSGITNILDYTPYNDPFKDFLAIPNDISDTVTPTPDAAPILLETSSGQVVGLRFPRIGEDSPGRVVFLSFPLDAIPESGAGGNIRVELLRNILNFLAPTPGVGQIVMDRTEYTIPSLVTVEVTDSDLVGQGRPSVSFSSDTDSAGQVVTLGETVRSGLFRGFITLVAADTPAPGAGELRAAHDDVIHVEYLDESSGLTRSASAVVETIPPIISNVISVPDFVEAVIRWDTDEPTDALVQFGESAFLGRTAYRATMDTHHEITLTGLQPNRIYQYKVVSRDHAGNTVTDDRQGLFYTFQTLTPLSPPWLDDLEQGDTDWQIIVTEGSEAAWELGVPVNSHGVSAYSPQNAWASNLGGLPIGAVESYLISPPILLTGGSQATLRFQQNYDFPFLPDDILELGEVLVFTDSTANPVTLGIVEDASAGWVEAQYDLSPYMGKLVRVAWRYVLLSFQNSPRLGWLIDDVSITVSGAASGVIHITNNLAQANWVLTGPWNQSGQGISTMIPDVPPGECVVSYGPVPFYQEPAPRTNTVVAFNQTVFQGNYTFADINTNGISDAWELDQFGEVSPERLPGTDTDGDGMSDLAEFIAGTDPKEPSSHVVMMEPVMQSGGDVQITWPSAVGRAYRVEGSVDSVNWMPVTDWMQATSGTVTYSLSPPASAATWFRFEVRP